MITIRKRREMRLGVHGERESVQKFVKVWKQALRKQHKGAATESIYFLDIDTMLRTLANRRMDLLHTLRPRGPMTARALSQLLKRDYKNVHADVKALRNAGLIETDEAGKVLVPWDRIAMEIPLAA